MLTLSHSLFLPLTPSLSLSLPPSHSHMLSLSSLLFSTFFGHHHLFVFLSSSFLSSSSSFLSSSSSSLSSSSSCSSSSCSQPSVQLPHTLSPQLSSLSTSDPPRLDGSKSGGSQAAVNYVCLWDECGERFENLTDLTTHLMLNVETTHLAREGEWGHVTVT